jgi:vancomycin resistance protein YoaR
MAILHHYKQQIKKLKKFPIKKKQLKHFGMNICWFILGCILGLFFFVSFLYISYQKTHTDRIYEGVLIDGINFGGKTKAEIQLFFENRNKTVQKTTITLASDAITATVSAQEIHFGYDSALLAQQAYTIGRSKDNIISNMSILIQAYMNTINLPAAYHYDAQTLNNKIQSLDNHVNIAPLSSLFHFEHGKVTTFRLGKPGRAIDEEQLRKTIIAQMQTATLATVNTNSTMIIPIKILPATDEKGNIDTMGITEQVSQGTSHFYHSAEDRIFNVSLAANRLNGILIKPDEIFSFVKSVGDISSLSGYRQAYVIQDGKTVLGDGGGVCQVSTTLFRAALSAGLPIIERHQHAYRVGYYEDGKGPGIDAAIYSPTVDLKFKNDTGHSLLIQTTIDLNEQRLTFTLYGTKDTRAITITDPVITSETPAPEPLYQDDPTLPKSTIKQIDFAAAGASVFFTRTVTQAGKPPLFDKFVSNYRPWQAIYLRGTKE